MGIFDRMKGAFGPRSNDKLVGDLAVDDGWALVPEASPATLLGASPSRIELPDPEDWEGIIRAAKYRDENLITVPTPEPAEEDADWEAMIARAKAQAPAQRVAPPVPPPALASSPPRQALASAPPLPPLPPPNRRGSVPPEAPRAAYVPVPRPTRRSAEDDWEAIIAKAKARAEIPSGPPVDEWAEVIKRAKTRAA